MCPGNLKNFIGMSKFRRRCLRIFLLSKTKKHSNDPNWTDLFSVSLCWKFRNKSKIEILIWVFLLNNRLINTRVRWTHLFHVPCRTFWAFNYSCPAGMSHHNYYFLLGKFLLLDKDVIFKEMPELVKVILMIKFRGEHFYQKSIIIRKKFF